MRRIRKIKALPALLLAVLLAALPGCSNIDSSQITRLDPAGTVSADSEAGEAEPLQEVNELPADGVVSAASLATIAGQEGIWRFTGQDPATGIAYEWSYDGTMIQNPVEQRLAVTFPEDELEAVKAAAGNAPEGLGLSLEPMSLAAPASLTLTLTEKWEADTVLFCKWLDGEVLQMDQAGIGTAEVNGEEVTTLTFQVMEAGDTYYLVGGVTQAAGGDEMTAGGESATGTGGADASSGGGENASEGTAGDGSAAAGNSTAGSDAAGDAGSGGTGGGADTEQPVHTCTISVECSTILDNWDSLNQNKTEFVPSDGYIIYPSVVEYSPGETVYDLLYRICRDNGIHMESRWTPAYGSYYVEGINQLYEFDCGDLSGWMYSVNGWFPNYGSSSYTISDGDIIEWRYTCDLGRDVGGYYATGL